MADPTTEPMTDMVRADGANGEAAAWQPATPSVEIALAGDEVRDDEVEQPEEPEEVEPEVLERLGQRADEEDGDR